jgi:transcriptional regulator with XRE-family HTH domain
MDPRDLRDAFAANLRRLRHERGISQEDLAYEAGINRSYMSKLEKGASSRAGNNRQARYRIGRGAGRTTAEWSEQ